MQDEQFFGAHPGSGGGSEERAEQSGLGSVEQARDLGRVRTSSGRRAPCSSFATSTSTTGLRGRLACAAGLAVV